MDRPDKDEGQPDGPEEDHKLPPGEFFRLAWFFYLVLAVSGVIWIGVSRGLELGVFLEPGRLGVDLALGAAAAFVLIGAWRLARLYFPPMRELESTMGEMIGPLDRSEVFVLALISGFAEELFFRGALLGSLGWIWSTLIFALLHTGPGPVFRIWTLFAAVAGLLFAGLTLHQGSLFAAFVAHFLVNWINLGALMRDREGTAKEDESQDERKEGKLEPNDGPW